MKNRKKCSSSDYLYPVVIEEHKHDLNIQEAPVRDEDKTFKSSANIQLKINAHFLPFHIGQFEVQKSIERSQTSFDENCVDAKQVNANILSPKQTVFNNSELQSTLQIVCHDNSKNSLPVKSFIKDDFFDKLLNDIEESIKDI